jgi:hypothetical protein
MSSVTETCPLCHRPSTIVRGVCSECGGLVSGTPPLRRAYRPGFAGLVDQLLDDLSWLLGSWRGRGAP